MEDESAFLVRLKPHATRYEAPQTHCWIKGNIMKQIQKISFGVVAAVMLLSLGGCAGMSTQDKNTAIGAGVGAVGGAVLTGGSTTGTIGGAAVGGVIGHEVDTDE